MDIASQTFTAISNLYSGMNKATLSGAIDVVVVRQPDGSLKCSPFHVRFGKLNVWNPAEKRVKLWINGTKAPVEMKLGPGGEAFFVHQVQGDEAVSKSMITSPITVPRMCNHNRSPPKLNDDGSPPLEPLNFHDESAGASAAGDDSDAERTPTAPSPPCELAAAGAAAAPPTDRADEATPPGEEADGADPISSWHWGSLPEQEEALYGKGRINSAPRRRLTSTSSDGWSVPAFQVVHMTKAALQALPLRPAAEGGGVELAAAMTVDSSTALSEGDALLSINGIGIDTMDMSQVRLIVDAVGTDSVELVLSSGTLPTSATPTWIRQLGRAFRDHSVDAPPRAAADGGGPVVEVPQAAAGGVALSLCGTDNLADFVKHQVSFPTFAEDHSALVRNPALVVMIGGDAYSWETAAPLLLSVAAYGRATPSATPLPKPQELAATSTEPPARSWWFFGSRKSSEQASAAKPPRSAPDPPTHTKSLTLNSEALESLGLQPGENEALFCVTSKMQGKAMVQCVIHLWEHDDNIVISDIDGTITRSDIMGHAANLIGTDWTHEGVASLYTKIHKNGYKFLYLTSRSISHAPLTRDYIHSVEQDTGVKLPRGPIMFSPDNFLMSIHREVIARNPQEFKIACLQSIAALFPPRSSDDGELVQCPFVAGFGNRHTDEEAYAAVNVPPSRVFTIDPSGNLKMGAALQQSSYVALQERTDLYFPPITAAPDHLAMRGMNRAVKGEVSPKKYSTFEYWNPEKDFMSGVDIGDELKALLS
mmetsp:Transcript_17985/g.53265  ORF Transcript_17985/g.53265 Transcript_17985/m.53265 type:complete len:764 (+) Transcript_17985:163-2454(+)